MYALVAARYGLDVGDWVFAAAAVLLVGYILAASVMLRRAGVALPGLLCGLFVAVAWLAMSGFTVAYLWLLPLTTAALGWAAAAATARMLPDLATAAPLPLTAARPARRAASRQQRRKRLDRRSRRAAGPEPRASYCCMPWLLPS